MTPSSGATPLTAPTSDDLATQVRHSLTQRPRWLPSRYLYDALGSALFEAICHLPWYPLTRAEHRLLESHAADIMQGGFSRIVELGPGSGEKLSTLIGNASAGHQHLEIHLVDVSPNALAQATRTLEQFRDVRLVSHAATYEDGLQRAAATRTGSGRTLALSLGSNIGNFDPPACEAFLRHLRETLRSGDSLLLGADLVKTERALLLAYDDPLGVTAAFNRNLLVRLNRELHGQIDVEAFAHRAVWNAAHSRVEMHLVSRRPQEVHLPGADLRFRMEESETIWTESSYKYEPPEITAMLERCRFATAAQWIDPVDRFALTRAVAG